MEQRGTHVFSVRLDPKSDASLELLATAAERSRGWILRKLIAQAVQGGEVRPPFPAVSEKERQG